MVNRALYKTSNMPLLFNYLKRCTGVFHPIIMGWRKVGTPVFSEEKTAGPNVIILLWLNSFKVS